MLCGDGRLQYKHLCQAFLSFSSLPFSLQSFPFSPETPDTQANRVPLEAACREQALNKSKSRLRPAVEFHEGLQDKYFLLIIYMV